MSLNKVSIRQLHSLFAPVMLLPVILTLIMGSLFQIAVITGKSEEFLWLLEWEQENNFDVCLLKEVSGAIYAVKTEVGKGLIEQHS